MAKIIITLILNDSEIPIIKQDYSLIWKTRLLNHQNTIMLNLKYNLTEKKSKLNIQMTK